MMRRNWKEKPTSQTKSSSTCQVNSHMWSLCFHFPKLVFVEQKVWHGGKSGTFCVKSEQCFWEKAFECRLSQKAAETWPWEKEKKKTLPAVCHHKPQVHLNIFQPSPLEAGIKAWDPPFWAPEPLHLEPGSAVRVVPHEASTQTTTGLRSTRGPRQDPGQAPLTEPIRAPCDQSSEVIQLSAVLRPITASAFCIRWTKPQRVQKQRAEGAEHSSHLQLER